VRHSYLVETSACSVIACVFIANRVPTEQRPTAATWASTARIMELDELRVAAVHGSATNATHRQPRRLEPVLGLTRRPLRLDSICHRAHTGAVDSEIVLLSCCTCVRFTACFTDARWCGVSSLRVSARVSRYACVDDG